MGVLIDVGILLHTFEHEAPALVTENGLERVLQHLLVARHPKEHGLLVAENVETSTRLHDEDVHRVLLVAGFSVQADSVATNCDSHSVSFQGLSNTSIRVADGVTTPKPTRPLFGLTSTEQSIPMSPCLL